MDCRFRDLTDFQSSEARLMTASAVHKLSEYIVFSDPCTAKELVFEAPWYCLTRFTIQARHWDFFVAGWMLVCVGACAAEAVII